MDSFDSVIWKTVVEYFGDDCCTQLQAQAELHNLPDSSAKTSLCTHVTRFLLKNVGNGSTNLDLCCLSLGCAKTLFESISTGYACTQEFGVMEEFGEDLIQLYSMSEIQKNSLTVCLFHECLVLLSFLLPCAINNFVANTAVALTSRLDLGTKFLLHPRAKIASVLWTSLTVQCVLSRDLNFVTVMNFFICELEHGQRKAVATEFRVDWTTGVEPFLDRVLLAMDDGLISSSFLIFLNKFLDYAGTLFILSSTDNPAEFRTVSKWIARNADSISSSHLRAASEFSCATGSVRGRAAFCRCSDQRLQMIVLLKAFCIIVRDTSEHSSTSRTRGELSSLIAALQSRCTIHSNASLPKYICAVLAKDDEDLCAALLCLLHLSLLLPEPTSRASSGLPSSPVEMFDALLDLISDDHYVIVSWITDNQNCFLAYFLQYLKVLTGLDVESRQRKVLEKVEASLTTLSDDGKVAFNLVPLLRRLRQIVRPS